ncbi:hypothetical protein GYH30_052153 [Glycine max]|uniref:uncharacterized protein n=1 Tax=Glycine max TaxID=3847 RepID=UPI00023D9A05|nr:uncharacterized protein LOC102666726 [Glycine max]KAH1076543.1 hypothetical protein GYH30_052153 [Glycine max]|eukprot:XP_006605041.1 uncharacterized protein LOC102666726 [Glycine max]
MRNQIPNPYSCSLNQNLELQATTIASPETPPFGTHFEEDKRGHNGGNNDGEAHHAQPVGKGRDGALHPRTLVIKALKKHKEDRKNTKNNKHNGNISHDRIFDIARVMRSCSMAKDLNDTIKEMLGTCISIVCTLPTS